MNAARSDLAGRRVLVTGAARGIGAALAQRLHQRGARVGLAGLEPDELASVASACGGAPWRECDVAERAQVQTAVEGIAGELGGLDVVVANAGIGAQMALVGGDPAIMERTLQVNTLGCFYTLAAAGPHISHPGGYALAVSSAAAGLHLPLMGAYCASKAATEAIGDCLRIELRPSGARVGVAYFAEIDTDMTSRGMRTRAAARITPAPGLLSRSSPLPVAVDALERGIRRRSRHVFAPGWVGAVMPARWLAQRAVEAGLRPARVADALRIALEEAAPFTTAQPTATRATATRAAAAGAGC